MDTEEEDLSLGSVFTEPPRPPSPEPTVETYTRDTSSTSSRDWSTVQISLVGSHPLWGHHLWNAARSFSSYLDAHPELYYNRCVLELGAGGGLPGIVAAKNGAKSVVLTDYPDASLIENLELNVGRNIPAETRDRVHVKGYIWGQSVQRLVEFLPRGSTGFDLIIMSDLIFNHSQHRALLKTSEQALSKSAAPLRPCLLVFYSHHRPHLAARDMEFFQTASDNGWICDKVVTEKFPPMFPADPGDEDVRATVHGWMLTRSDS